MSNHKLIRGFSLAELTIVLLVMSIVAAGGLEVYSQKKTEDARNVTNQRLDVIEKALEQYRIAHHRLPCPADGSIKEGATNFGFEGSLPGSCTSGSPAANFSSGNTVAGVVPIRTLELNDEYLYDGWGRRFQYAVDKRMTEVNAFITYTPYDSSIGDITIKDAEGNERLGATGKAMYALISFGKNGHGAYLQSGQRLNAQSTNTDERDNAGVNAAFANVFDNVFVMRAPTENSANHLDVFDDIVRYKQRWNMAEGNDEAELQDTEDISTYSGPDMLVPSIASPYVLGFDFDDVLGVMVDYAGPVFASGSELTTEVWDMDLNATNEYLAICLDVSPWFAYYIWSDTGFVKQGAPNPTSMPNICKTKWSPDGIYLAVGIVNYAGPGTINSNLRIYKRDTTTNQLTLLDPGAGYAAAGGGVGINYFDLYDAYSMDWDSTGTFLAVGGEYTQHLALYKRTGDSFIDLYHVSSTAFCSINRSSWCDPSGSTCAAACTSGRKPDLEDWWSVAGVDFSPDDRFLVVAGGEYESAIMYHFNPAGPVYLTQTNSFSAGKGTLGSGEEGVETEFSYDGTYLVEGSWDGWRLYKYNSGTDRYDKVAEEGAVAPPSTNCTTNGLLETDWHPSDNRYFYFGVSGIVDFVTGSIDTATNVVTCKQKSDGIGGNNWSFGMQFKN